MKISKNKGNYEKTLVIPIEYEMWQTLRRIAYENEVSMSQLTRSAIEKVINKFERKSIDT